MNRAFRRYKKNTIQLYSYFKPESSDHLDYSDEAILDMLYYESQGIELDSNINGWFWSKKWMDITLTNWKESIEEGLLTKWELIDSYSNDPLMHKFVTNFVKNIQVKGPIPYNTDIPNEVPDYVNTLLSNGINPFPEDPDLKDIDFSKYILV